MGLFNKKLQSYQIKNLKKWRFERNFRMHTIGILLYFLFSAAGIAVHIALFGMPEHSTLQKMLIATLVLLVGLLIFSRWETLVKLAFLLFFAGLYFYGLNSFAFTGMLFIGGIMLGCLHVMKEWERAVVLRLGKFKRIKGPGFFILMPFIDTITDIVDLRIRVSDFATETTLTNDSVTVTVDALCFWMVWDAEKAILEVENYIEAVVFSSQTALRNAISMHSLHDFLSNGEEIEKNIRLEVDKKTTEWGITIQHIEITDIQIPENLQVELSKKAIAEKEKAARIHFGEAELELAELYAKAADVYKLNDEAFKLRTLNVINEGLKQGNSMILTPSTLSEPLEDGILGTAAIEEVKRLKKAMKDKESS